MSGDFGKNFEDLIEIRNIYAHYPEDVFNDSFYIETSHNQFQSMKELNNKFVEVSQKIYEELSKITKHIVEEIIKQSFSSQ